MGWKGKQKKRCFINRCIYMESRIIRYFRETPPLSRNCKYRKLIPGSKLESLKLESLKLESLKTLNFKLIVVCLLFLSLPIVSRAQCGTPISTFPYTEGFETAQAWTSGGTHPDWAWGTPTH